MSTFTVDYNTSLNNPADILNISVAETTRAESSLLWKLCSLADAVCTHMIMWQKIPSEIPITSLLKILHYVINEVKK